VRQLIETMSEGVGGSPVWTLCQLAHPCGVRNSRSIRLTSAMSPAGNPPDKSEQIPCLQLEHPRRVHVRERRERVRAPDASQLPKCLVRGARVAVDRLPPSKIVSEIEQVEAFQSQQDRSLLQLQAPPPTKTPTSEVGVPRPCRCM
jgi:hypothetical protein